MDTLIVVVSEGPMNVSEREIRIQLDDFVGIVPAVFVCNGDIFDPDTSPYNRGGTIAVCGILNDTHTETVVANGYKREDGEFTDTLEISGRMMAQADTVAVTAS